MNNHTAVERKLKTDIYEKNRVRKILFKHIATLNRWEVKQENASSKKLQRKLAGSIARYQAEMDILIQILQLMNDDVEKRIRDEMTFSEDEIKAFQKKLEVNAKTLEETKKELKNAKKAKDKSDSDTPSPQPQIHLKKLLKAEIKQIQADEAELVSEERDKILFTHELKRITLDRTLFSAPEES